MDFEYVSGRHEERLMEIVDEIDINDAVYIIGMLMQKQKAKVLKGIFKDPDGKKVYKMTIRKCWGSKD